MPTLTVTEKEQWASSNLTKALREALQRQKEELKEAWATGMLEEDKTMQKALGAIQNIDSTLSAIDDLSREEKQNDPL